MKIVFLGRLVDVTGQSERAIDLPGEIDDVDGLRAWLGLEIPALLDPKIRLIVNDTLAQRGQHVSPVDEVAFFPPLSGG